ncbi:MAG: aminopeptidase [Bacteroidetes bacterium]|nr:aminopeptidase [Bacteroidota bacterium]
MKSIFKIFRNLFEFIFIAVIFYVTFNFSLVAYGIVQLRGQLSIVWNAKPIEEVFADPAFPDSLKAKLTLIEDIKQFAIDSLGLKPTKNYSTIYDQHGKPLLLNLTAADKFRLKAYNWTFPLLGNVSYKGFFDFAKGEHEASQLKKQNFDVEFSSVSAWSTLGWFRDPVFSGMLKRNEGQLAELIIHEMTHATIYLKSSVDFNENLASAIGETGAEIFLASKFGIQSAQLETYRNEQEDYNRYAKHLLGGTKLLDSLYRSIENLADVEKESLKKDMIQRIVNSLDTIPFHNIKYKTRFEKEELPNNAYFLSFVRYDSQKEEMKRELNEKFKGEINSYLNFLNESH